MTKPQQEYATFKLRLAEHKAKPCMDCGGEFPPECMDFDHRNGSTKSFVIARACGRRWETVEAEIAKCDLVCANCHRIRTRKRADEHLRKERHELRVQHRQGSVG